MTRPRGSFATAAASFALPFEAFRLLRRERSLWPLAAAPALLSLLALGGATAALSVHGAFVHDWIADSLPQFAAGAWYSWLWVGPGQALVWLATKALFVLAAVAILVVAFLLASVLAAPLHELLSRRVEALVTGRVEEITDEGFGPMLADGLRAMFEELRRVLFFLAVTGVLVAVGILVPGGQVVAPPALTLFTIFFLPLDYASHVLDRRRLRFRDKRRWLARRTPATLGFGGAAFAACAIPGVNFLAMPVLVVAGTLFALRESADGFPAEEGEGDVG